MRGGYQPYRPRVGRQGGAALAAMMLGAPGFLPNPQHVARRSAKRRRGAALAQALAAQRRR